MIPDYMVPFVETVLTGADLIEKGYEILDYDSERIYLAVGSKEYNYNIRIWNVDSGKIEFTFFKPVEDGQMIVSLRG